MTAGQESTSGGHCEDRCLESRLVQTDAEKVAWQENGWSLCDVLQQRHKEEL